MGTTNSKEPNSTVSSTDQAGGGGGGRTTRPLSALLKRSGASSDTNDFTPQPPDSTSPNPYFVLVKAKTRLHNSNRLIRKSTWYEAKPNASLTIGRSDQCDLVLEDDRCAPINARLSYQNNLVYLVAEARMYRLIGMGQKPKSLLIPLSLGMVIKVGSVSLEVTQLCTKEGDNFLQRFDAELSNPLPNSSTEASRMNRGHSKESMVTDQSEDEGADDTSSQPPIPENEEPAPAICYICWGGPEDPVSEEELNQVKSKTGATSTTLKHDPNPLIRNPCGKCSGSSRYVHLQCILTWIKSSGSGHCSICNGALPQHFSSPPPNLELKVVRHRRGHSWVGNRRFRLSFVEKSFATIGRDGGCEVRLSDRSVCGEHAKLLWDRDQKTFFIQDCASVTGTYVQLVGQLELPYEEPTYVKIGRSTLSFRLASSKRTSIVSKMFGKG